MPLPADLSPPDSTPTGPAADAAFFGGRWACGLCGWLLILFALTILARRLPADSPAKAERIIQQPVTPEISAASTQRSEVTAPDPGDNPP